MACVNPLLACSRLVSCCCVMHAGGSPTCVPFPLPPSLLCPSCRPWSVFSLSSSGGGALLPGPGWDQQHPPSGFAIQAKEKEESGCKDWKGLMKVHPKDCNHNKCKRYGNAHGRYADCLECGTKWIWSKDKQLWVDRFEAEAMKSPPDGSKSRSSRSQPLPPPSSMTIAPVEAMPKAGYTPADLRNFVLEQRHDQHPLEH